MTDAYEDPATTETDSTTSTDLEVAVLSRSNGRRAFRRIEDAELASLLPAI